MNSKQMALQIRRYCIDLAHGTHAVHIGGSLSMTDILAVLYSSVLRYDAQNPLWADRDRLIISKGHSSSAYYSALACAGYLTKEQLMTQYQDGSLLSGHVSHHVNGVEISTGSLGHGLPIACGMALVAKHKQKKHRLFTIMGDGECQEGTTWEAALFAGHNQLDQLTAVVDANALQSGAFTKDVLGLEEEGIRQMFVIAGWKTVSVDGHDHNALREAFALREGGRPLCIVAHTVKGKGVSFMENNPMYHSNRLSDELYKQAMEELEETR